MRKVFSDKVTNLELIWDITIIQRRWKLEMKSKIFLTQLWIKNSFRKCLSGDFKLD